MAYQAPALPVWSAKAPAHVTRQLLGRFLQDRDTGVVHDVYAAKPECLVDAIPNGTFFHFWSEVVTDASVADDLPCPASRRQAAGQVAPAARVCVSVRRTAGSRHDADRPDRHWGFPLST